MDEGLLLLVSWSAMREEKTIPSIASLVSLGTSEWELDVEITGYASGLDVF